jgi:plastocyanin
MPPTAPISRSSLFRGALPMPLSPLSASLVLSLAVALWAAGAPPAVPPGPRGPTGSRTAPPPGGAAAVAPAVAAGARQPAGTTLSAAFGHTRADARPQRLEGRPERRRGAPHGTGTPGETGRGTAGTQAASGRIAGTVRLTRAAPRELRTDAYASRVVRPSPRQDVPEVRHVVVFLTGMPPQANLPLMRAVVRQRDESFEPRVVAITRGSTVDFPNEDPFFHNVFSLSRAASFDLGRYPKGQSRSRVFPKAGLVKLYCDLHSYMSAVIFVFDHPWFAVPDAAGRFVLDEVPAGRHTLMAWHERIGESEVAVIVEPGRTSEVEFVLPVLES